MPYNKNRKGEDVVNNLEMVDNERNAYYNKIEGNIFFSDMEEYISQEESEKWLEDTIMLPTRYEIDEYSMMEQFIETINDSYIQNKLLSEIQGKKAFRNFKDACISFNL